MTGKFDSARDEFLHQLSLNGTEPSSGHVEAPTGAYSLLIITEDELPALRDEFDTTEESAITPGNFLLVEDGNGFITVTEHLTRAAAEAAYSQLEDRYSEWLSA